MTLTGSPSTSFFGRYSFWKLGIPIIIYLKCGVPASQFPCIFCRISHGGVAVMKGFAVTLFRISVEAVPFKLLVPNMEELAAIGFNKAKSSWDLE